MNSSNAATSTLAIPQTPSYIATSQSLFPASTIFQTTTAPSTSGIVTATTLTGTQTSIPGISTTTASRCGLGLLEIPSVNPACGMQASNNSLNYLEQCCNGAPRVLYNNGCNVYCNAQNQTLKQLGDCLHSKYNLTVDGQMICNRGGVSYSSLLPEETDPRSFAPTPTTSTAAANRKAAVAGGEGVSLAGVGTVVVLVAVGLFGSML